jgi:hypothetical protein
MQMHINPAFTDNRGRKSIISNFTYPFMVRREDFIDTEITLVVHQINQQLMIQFESTANKLAFKREM